jgi:hypothetical protein
MKKRGNMTHLKVNNSIAIDSNDNEVVKIQNKDFKE